MLIKRVKCELCGKEFKAISHTHLVKHHDVTLREYMVMFPDAPIYEKAISAPSNGADQGKTLLLDAVKRVMG